MNVTVHIDVRGNYHLPASVALGQVPASAYSRHHSLGLRSAVGAYNTSVATVAQRLARTTRALDSVVSPPSAAPQGKQSDKDELLDSYESLLHALMHHVEDCVGVLKGFTRDDVTFAKHPSIKAYGKSVRAYRSHIGLVVNRIKHQQGRLRLMTVRMGGTRFGGYFVERGLPDGGVGPDPDIHETGLTAFSFNRDLKFHLCSVIVTSQALGLAIARVTGAQEGDVPNRGQPLGTCLRDVINLPETYFPDEYEKPRPFFELESDSGGGSQLRVGFAPPDDSWRPFAGRQFQVTLELRGDGATRSWKVPYSPGPAAPNSRLQPTAPAAIMRAPRLKRRR